MPVYDDKGMAYDHDAAVQEARRLGETDNFNVAQALKDRGWAFHPGNGNNVRSHWRQTDTDVKPPHVRLFFSGPSPALQANDGPSNGLVQIEFDIGPKGKPQNFQHRRLINFEPAEDGSLAGIKLGETVPGLPPYGPLVHGKNALEGELKIIAGRGQEPPPPLPTPRPDAPNYGALRQAAPLPPPDSSSSPPPGNSNPVGGIIDRIIRLFPSF